MEFISHPSTPIRRDKTSSTSTHPPGAKGSNALLLLSVDLDGFVVTHQFTIGLIDKYRAINFHIFDANTSVQIICPVYLSFKTIFRIFKQYSLLWLSLENIFEWAHPIQFKFSHLSFHYCYIGCFLFVDAIFYLSVRIRIQKYSPNCCFFVTILVRNWIFNIFSKLCVPLLSRIFDADDNSDRRVPRGCGTAWRCTTPSGWPARR